jgi:hypothetical protein
MLRLGTALSAKLLAPISHVIQNLLTVQRLLLRLDLLETAHKGKKRRAEVTGASRVSSIRLDYVALRDMMRKYTDELQALNSLALHYE